MFDFLAACLPESGRQQPAASPSNQIGCSADLAGRMGGTTIGIYVARRPFTGSLPEPICSATSTASSAGGEHVDLGAKLSE